MPTYHNFLFLYFCNFNEPFFSFLPIFTWHTALIPLHSILFSPLRQTIRPREGSRPPRPAFFFRKVLFLLS